MQGRTTPGEDQSSPLVVILCTVSLSGSQQFVCRRIDLGINPSRSRNVENHQAYTTEMVISGKIASHDKIGGRN